MDLLNLLSGDAMDKSDERSLIYMTGDGTHAIVSINFSGGVNLCSENYVNTFLLYKGVGESASNSVGPVEEVLRAIMGRRVQER
jgi:hypothetical protein